MHVHARLKCLDCGHQWMSFVMTSDLHHSCAACETGKAVVERCSDTMEFKFDQPESATRESQTGC